MGQCWSVSETRYTWADTCCGSDVEFILVLPFRMSQSPYTEEQDKNTERVRQDRMDELRLLQELREKCPDA